MKNGVKIQREGFQLGARLRVFYFLFSIAFLGFFVAYVASTPLYLLARFRPSLRAKADGVMCRGVGLLLRVQWWLKYQVQIDLPQLPREKGILLVSNHRSHLDVFMLLAHVSGIRVLAKSTLFLVPGLGFMMRMTRQIPVQRGQAGAFLAAMDEVKKRLRQREVIHIFPEMTRCQEGYHGVLPFALAPFHAAIQENVTILPLVVQGTDEYWPKGFLGLKRGSQIRVRSLQPVKTSDFDNAEALKNHVYRQIQEALA